MHPFIHEIRKYPDLETECDLTIPFPEPYRGAEKLRAILLGADPTNGGIHKGDKQIAFKAVFGLKDGYAEFFRHQLTNLKAINLHVEQLYIQNVCRNYFRQQTSRNKKWDQIADIWLPFLKQELDCLDKNLPLLITAERIMKVLVPDVPKAQEFYSLKAELPLFSKKLERLVFPLYRHPAYYVINHQDYCKFLTSFLS